jgi:hypothetical protein
VSGVSFTGWAGAPTNISGNPITLKMDRSYSITAEFKDTQKPVIGELSITSSDVLINEEITIRATATDNVGIQKVVAQIKKPNNESEELTFWKEDSGAYSAVYRPNIAGKYKVTVQAKDIQGNLSDAKMVEFNVNGVPRLIIIPPKPEELRPTRGRQNAQITFRAKWENASINLLNQLKGKIIAVFEIINKFVPERKIVIENDQPVNGDIQKGFEFKVSLSPDIYMCQLRSKTKSGLLSEPSQLNVTVSDYVLGLDFGGWEAESFDNNNNNKIVITAITSKGSKTKIEFSTNYFRFLIVKVTGGKSVVKNIRFLNSNY